MKQKGQQDFIDRKNNDNNNSNNIPGLRSSDWLQSSSVVQGMVFASDVHRWACEAAPEIPQNELPRSVTIKRTFWQGYILNPEEMPQAQRRFRFLRATRGPHLTFVFPILEEVVSLKGVSCNDTDMSCRVRHVVQESPEFQVGCEMMPCTISRHT